MKTILYLGLDPMNQASKEHILHCPLISIKPRAIQNPEIVKAFKGFADYTHVLFTSKTAVNISLDYLSLFGWDEKTLKNKILIAIGSATAKHLTFKGYTPNHIAHEETSEGVVQEMLKILPTHTFLFWPHSSLSRPIISNFLANQRYLYQECLLYDIVPIPPQSPIVWKEINEIIFTSPSTVDAFYKYFGSPPLDKVLTSIGPVTRNYLGQMISTQQKE